MRLTNLLKLWYVKSMRALVSGGAGFIGSRLALELEKNGAEVHVIDSFLSLNFNNLSLFKGPVIQHDLLDDWTSSGKWDVIFHQAAITDPRHESDEEVYEKNVRGFEKLLKLALQSQAKLIYASTAGLYGNGAVPMKEAQEKEVLTAYGRSKLKMDEIAESHFNQLHLVGLRYFNVFGPHEAHKGRPASMIYHLWKQMVSGQRPRLFKWGEQSRDFIYVKDVVRANLCAIHAPSGIYNVGTGVASTFNTVVRILNEVLGTSLEPDYFDMPYESKTYQHCTLADTSYAETGLNFKTEWDLKSAIFDYVKWLEKTEGSHL